MTVLCVVAHPDDEILGIGGTLARHATQGDDVHVCILSDGVTSRYADNDNAKEEITRRRERATEACQKVGASVTLHDFPDNSFDTVQLLDIVQKVESEIERTQPTTVYTHHQGDLNVDHELTARAVLTATRPLKDSVVDRVYSFETLSATEWSAPIASNAFQPTTFVGISEHLPEKLEALSVYENELRDSPHPRTIETVRKNAEVWGAKSGMDAAEPLMLLRETRL